MGEDAGPGGLPAGLSWASRVFSVVAGSFLFVRIIYNDVGAV